MTARTVEQVMAIVPNASFVRIGGHMWRLDGHTFEEDESFVYLLDEDSGNIKMLDLDEEEDVEVMANAIFYKIGEIK
jgi:hypothetical protein